MKAETDTQLVIDYIMEHEPCLGSQVIEALKLRPGAVTSILSRLKDKGMIQHVAGTTGRSKLWEMAPEYVEPATCPFRPSVSTWTPYHHRHWMDVALFGEALITQ